MSAFFESVSNHNEQAVFRAVKQHAGQFPGLASDPGRLADVACVALNRLTPRYIRHEADLAFYQGERERQAFNRDLNESVEFAFGYVQARVAMRARA